MHQPSGLILPDTILQAFGASQFTQVSHLLPSFGVSWYCTIAGAILSCAWAPLTATAPPTTARPARSTWRRVASLSYFVIVSNSFAIVVPTRVMARQRQCPGHAIVLPNQSSIRFSLKYQA